MAQNIPQGGWEGKNDDTRKGISGLSPRKHPLSFSRNRLGTAIMRIPDRQDFRQAAVE